MDAKTATPAMDALKAQHKDFVRAYMVTRRPIDAAKEAGYSAHSAATNAYKLMDRADIRAAIAEAELAAQERNNLRLDDVIAEYRKIAFGGLSKFIRISPDGDPIIDLSGCTPEDLDLLESAEIDDEVEGRGEDQRTIRKIKIKRLDKLKALEVLGKHLGIFNKSEGEIVDKFTLALAEISKRGSSMPIGPQAGVFDDEVEQ